MEVALDVQHRRLIWRANRAVVAFIVRNVLLDYLLLLYYLFVVWRLSNTIQYNQEVISLTRSVIDDNCRLGMEEDIILLRIQQYHCHTTMQSNRKMMIDCCCGCVMMGNISKKNNHEGQEKGIFSVCCRCWSCLSCVRSLEPLTIRSDFDSFKTDSLVT